MPQLSRDTGLGIKLHAQSMQTANT